MASPARRALGSKAFRRLFLAQTVSRWGDTFNFVALVIVVYRLTGSGVGVAATVAFEVIPVLLFGFVAGIVIDRLPRKRVMVAADLARAGVALILVFFHDQLPVLYASAFLLSTFSMFFNPASASVVPGTVEEDDVVGANAALWSAAVVSQIALAPLAGAVVSFAGPEVAFGINAVSFVVSALALRGLDVEKINRVTGKVWHDVTEGFEAIRRSPFLRVLTVVQILAALSTGATSALLVVLAREHLRVGPSRFGLLLSAIGLGAAVGPLVLQRVVQEVRRPGLLFGPYVLRGAGDLVLALSRSFGISAGALVGYGIGTSTGMVTYNTVLQRNVDDSLRGRVFAFFDVVWQGSRLVSIGVGGILAEVSGIQAVYLIGAALLLVAGFFGLARLPAGVVTERIGSGSR